MVQLRHSETKYEDNLIQLPTEGVQPALIYAVVDLGLQPAQPGSPYSDKPTWTILLMFELQEKLPEGKHAGEPFSVRLFLTNSGHKKSNLVKNVFQPLGIDPYKVRDLEQALVGQLCQVNIVYKWSEKRGRSYANIKGALQLPRHGDKAWKLYNGKSNPDWTFPKFAQKKRMNALEPPADLGCKWEPEEEGQGQTQPVMDRPSQASQPSQAPPEQEHPLDKNPNNNEDETANPNGQIPF